MTSLTLGSSAPVISNLHFENSDVFGEFRINCEARLDAPSCLAKINVQIGHSVRIGAELSTLNINTDFQLLVRMSTDNGLTLIGVKLRKKLGLDYVIRTKMGKLNTIGGFPLQKVLNDTIDESLWWLSHPCMLLLPSYPAADGDSGSDPSFLSGSDMEASQFDRPVGQLEVRVKSAHNLPVGDWRTKSSDPYVRFGVEKSWPLRSFRTRMVSETLNPVFEHSVSTSLRWNESETGVLLFEVFDHNEVGADDKLGMVEVPIKMVAKRKDSAQIWDQIVRLREIKDEKTRGVRNHATLALHTRYYPTHLSE